MEGGRPSADGVNRGITGPGRRVPRNSQICALFFSPPYGILTENAISKTKGVIFAMKIDSKIENGKACFTLEGRLDTTTAPELENALKGALESANELTLDFSKLDYISSAGLRVLLSAHKAMSGKGGMKLIHVNEIVSEVLEITGFADILTIE